jgi:multiple sugar transport system permease protein
LEEAAAVDSQLVAKNINYNRSVTLMAKLGYLALVPLIITLGALEVYPLAYSAWLSLTSTGGAFVGFANYSQVLQNGTFWGSVSVSLLYAMGSTAVAFALGLGFTFLLFQAPRGKAVFESIFVVPLALPPIVVGALWAPAAVWDDVETFVHFILRFPYFNELSPLFFFPVMTFSDAWEWSPLIMLVSLSILGSIKPEVFEAAALHGGSQWQNFRSIALSAIVRSPVMGFVLILRFVDAMRAFEVPFAWAGWVGYPQAVGTPVDTVSLYLYKLMFYPIYNFPIQYISAVAIALLVVTMVGAAILLRLMSVLRGSPS